MPVLRYLALGDSYTSGPVDLGPGINDHTAGVFQDNPHLSADGQGLWFTSTRAGGAGLRDLWFSLYSNGSWSTPVNMGPPFNTAGEEDQIWVGPGASPDIYWNSSDGLKRCTWKGSSYASAPVTVSIPGCAYAAEASMTGDGASVLRLRRPGDRQGDDHVFREAAGRELGAGNACGLTGKGDVRPAGAARRRGMAPAGYPDQMGLGGRFLIDDKCVKKQEVPRCS